METLLSLQPKMNENWTEFTSRLSNTGHELLLMMSGRAKKKFEGKDCTTKQFMEILMDSPAQWTVLRLQAVADGIFVFIKSFRARRAQMSKQ